MPLRKQFSGQQIDDTAFEIAGREGMAPLRVRGIAEALPLESDEKGQIQMLAEVGSETVTAAGSKKRQSTAACSNGHYIATNRRGMTIVLWP